MHVLLPSRSLCHTGLKLSTLLAIAALIIALLSLTGCQALTAPPEKLPPLAPGAVMLGSDALTVTLLQNAKPADRQELANVMNDLGQAIGDAASTPPDFTALNALINQRLATWKSPYAPIVIALAQQILADVQTQLAGQTSPTAGSVLIKAAARGMQMGSLFYLQTATHGPVPTTSPGG